MTSQTKDVAVVPNIPADIWRFCGYCTVARAEWVGPHNCSGIEDVGSAHR